MKQLLLVLLGSLSTIPAFAQWYEQPVYAVTSQQPAQEGDEPANAIDGDLSTIYHSKWGQTGIPDELKFYFTSQVASIGKIIYSPRQSGGNGIWTDVSLYYSTQSDPTNFILISANLIWADDNTDKEILLTPTIVNPYAVKFVVHDAYGDFSSCAEMTFYSDTQASAADNGVDCTISTADLALNGTGDVKATIELAGSTASSFQSGENIENSFDNDPSTIYHSSWSNTVFPVVLNYRLNGTTPIDFLKYIPRTSGSNGDFGNVTIAYNTTGNSTYQDLMTFDFGQSGQPTLVQFPSQITPLNIRITVADGYGDFASCAEMEFYTAGYSSFYTPYQNVFTDNLYQDLLPGVTQAHIDTMSSDFHRNLAQCLFNETYIHQFRVQSYEVYRPVSDVRDELKTSSYDRFENATGIVFDAGEKIALFARNIPGASVSLAIKDFANGGFSGDVSYYELRNGLNVFEITNGGLGYINYYNADLSLNDVELNIVSGKVNGYFDLTTSDNDEWPALVVKTCYPMIDLRGEYAHMVYHKYALQGGSPFDCKALIQKYDTIVRHERMVMGLFKYNRSPKNRMLAISNHGNGWYAGGNGVNLDLEWGPSSVTNPNYLSIWGIAHEFGHVNQLGPDLKWIGTTEVTNNIYSVWVDYHMDNPGEHSTRQEDSSEEPAPGIPSITGGTINGAIYNTTVNGEALQGNADYDVFKVLVPFWQLEIYYSLAGASRNAPVLSFDYPTNYTGTDYAHWYGTVCEMVRTTDNDGLTNGEYLLNFVKNTCDAVEEDLTDFFVKTGFLRPIDREIDDYGVEQLLVTQAQIDDVIAYVQSKGYEQPVSPVIHYASAHSVHMYRDQLPLSGITGVGCSLAGNYLEVQHSEWPNAVAYETYDADNNLIYVSISGSGDPDNEMTKVYYPSNALAVYAVGFDGHRILVYPTSIISVKENNAPASLSIYPNPIGKTGTVQMKLDNAAGDYSAQVFTLDGRKVFSGKGTVEAIESQLNLQLAALNAGSYILSLVNTDGQQQKVRFVKD